MSRKLKAAIIGSGNIGTDLMIKILRYGQHLESKRSFNDASQWFAAS